MLIRHDHYTRAHGLAPFVAGVEYFSGLEPGGGKRWIPWMGRPLEISGFTTTASPEHRRGRKSPEITTTTE